MAGGQGNAGNAGEPGDVSDCCCFAVKFTTTAVVFIAPSQYYCTGVERHRGNTLFRLAVTLISSQWLPHKITNSRAVLIARIHVR